MQQTQQVANKIILIILFLIGIRFELNAQTLKVKGGDTIFSKNVDSILDLSFEISTSESKDRLLSLYADSINSIDTTYIIPLFLLNSCFDNSIFFWEGAHTPISAREIIMGKVTNKNSLRKLICLNEKKMSLICNLRHDGINSRIPLHELSFYQLIVRRYNELISSPARPRSNE